MAETQGGTSLEVRIARIEKMLEGFVGRREAVELSPEEIKAYQKVRDVIAADWGEFCGINDCFRCIIVRCVSRCGGVARCVVRCDVECVCGPCSLGSYGRLAGAVSRFGDLGE